MPSVLPNTCPVSGMAHSPAIVSRCGGPTPEELNTCGICGAYLTQVNGAWLAISEDEAFLIRETARKYPSGTWELERRNK